MFLDYIHTYCLIINKLTKVTVCPPKNTLTNLNYDIEMHGNMTVDEERKTELTNFIMDELHDPYFENMMENLNSFYEENRFYNWYHGYTKIDFPFGAKSYFIYGTGTDVIEMHVFTTTPSGTISTPYFGKEYNASLYKDIKYEIKIYVPFTIVQSNVNFTLFWRENKTDGSNKFDLVEQNYTSDSDYLYRWEYDYFFKKSYDSLYATSTSTVLMPGFQLQWNFDLNIPSDEKYIEDNASKLYVR